MEVNYFEIPVHDMPRATSFYEAVFEEILIPLDLGQIQMALFEDAGALIYVQGVFTPSHQGVMVYFKTDDIDAILARVVKYGGKLIREKTMISDTFKYMGCFEDSEGNRIALRQK